ncbi:MAG: DNA recombination protein RmuC [Bacteroidaceae bacterium]|jgi:DNA recombination protein RmuC|nr:DNA recombination protein RmuC [Bacteroidaceae bacterium]
MEIIFAIVLGVVLGAFIGFVVARGKNKEQQNITDKLRWQLENEKSNAELVSQSLQQQIANTKSEAREQIESIKADCEKRVAEIRSDAEKQSADALAAQEKRHEEAIKAQQGLFDETMAKVTAQVKSATDDMLKQRQKEFAESSNTNLGQIVNPLRETIEKMKQTMNDSTLKQTELSSEMKVNLENMMKHSEAAKQSADELARVFKHKSKVQGDWGERVLDELLASQGLTQGIHYDIQATIRDAAGNVVRTDTGSNLRPDVIMHIDNNREIIIDSKVSLTAFWDYINAENEEDRQKHLKAHIESIQRHVKELSKKDYSSYIKAPKVRMDYVIMFVSHTGALWTALNAQPDLWRKAMEMNVFIADEQTLFAALRMISLTWAHIAQAENHEKVYELANEILDRVGKFMKSYENIGKAIESAQKAYEDGEKKLTPGGQSIINTCAKLEKLGAKQSSKNPIRQIESVTGIE